MNHEVTVESPPDLKDHWLYDHISTEPVIDMESQAREHKRQERLELCGTPIWITDPITAKMKSYISACKIWRECAKCFEKRVEKFKERYQRASFQSADLRTLVLDDEEDARVIIRQLRKQESLYWRIPTEDKVVLLFDGEQTDIIGEDELPSFEDLAQTPEKKRYTGKLGQEYKGEKEDEGEVLTVTLLRFGKIEGMKPRAIQIAANAASRTVERMPDFTVMDIEYMCGLTMEEFSKNIHAMGGVVKHKQWDKIKVSYRAYTEVYRDRHDMTRDNVISDAQVAFTEVDSILNHSIEDLYAY